MNATTSKPHATLKALALISIALLLISGLLAIFYTQPESIGKPAFYTMLLLVIVQGPLAGVFSYALKGSIVRAIFACLFSWAVPLIGLVLLATYHRQASEASAANGLA